jgi:hypothetical protein
MYLFDGRRCHVPPRLNVAVIHDDCTCWVDSSVVVYRDTG